MYMYKKNTKFMPTDNLDILTWQYVVGKVFAVAVKQAK